MTCNIDLKFETGQKILWLRSFSFTMTDISVSQNVSRAGELKRTKAKKKNRKKETKNAQQFSWTVWQ